jgi:hypothetical protein
MKKLIFAALFAVSCILGLPLFAQQKFSEGKESEYFYVNIAIEKIYPYRAGYVIQYRKGVNQIARAYIPGEWFSDAAGKGELLYLPSGKAWPSLTVYYKSGEFSHVRLYVHRWQGHETWGYIPLNVNIDDRFENIDTIKLDF